LFFEENIFVEFRCQQDDGSPKFRRSGFTGHSQQAVMIASAQCYF